MVFFIALLRCAYTSLGMLRAAGMCFCSTSVNAFTFLKALVQQVPSLCLSSPYLLHWSLCKQACFK